MQIFGDTFKTVTEELGEYLFFENKQKVKASLKHSTKAAYNLAQRQYFFEGYCVSSFADKSPIKGGMYFDRQSIPNKKYMVVSIGNEYTSNDLSYLYCCETNDKVTLQNPIHIEEDYNTTLAFKTYQKDVFCFWNTTVRNLKQTNDGTLEQTIYTMIIPAKYGISVGDRIVRKGFSNGKFGDLKCKVDSIDSSLMCIEDEKKVKISGIVYLQLSEDLR